MTTQTIGSKEFRQNFKKLCVKGRKQNICYIVMSHQVPVCRVEPIDEDQLILEKYADQIERGIQDFRKGKFLTSEQVRKNLGFGK